MAMVINEMRQQERQANTYKLFASGAGKLDFYLLAMQPINKSTHLTPQSYSLNY